MRVVQPIVNWNKNRTERNKLIDKKSKELAEEIRQFVTEHDSKVAWRASLNAKNTKKLHKIGAKLNKIRTKRPVLSNVNEVVGSKHELLAIEKWAKENNFTVLESNSRKLGKIANELLEIWNVDRKKIKR